jgi:hypothetical protein
VDGLHQRLANHEAGDVQQVPDEEGREPHNEVVRVRLLRTATWPSRTAVVQAQTPRPRRSTCRSRKTSPMEQNTRPAEMYFLYASAKGTFALRQPCTIIACPRPVQHGTAQHSSGTTAVALQQRVQARVAARQALRTSSATGIILTATAASRGLHGNTRGGSDARQKRRASTQHRLQELQVHVRDVRRHQRRCDDHGCELCPK